MEGVIIDAFSAGFDIAFFSSANSLWAVHYLHISRWRALGIGMNASSLTSILTLTFLPCNDIINEIQIFIHISEFFETSSVLYKLKCETFWK
jgi:hypothetical protein